MKKSLLLLCGLLFIFPLFAQETGTDFQGKLNNFFQPLLDFLDKILFFDPFAALGFEFGVKIPFIIIWLIFGAVFFTIYLRFINLRGLKHAWELVVGKYDKDGHEGEISHFQAISTACASTVGLGNIAGVAVAIAMGGPGATFWLIIAGFLGMTTKFTECTLGVKYRKMNPDNSVSGGPMYYLRDGLAKKGLKNTGKVLAVLFAVFASIGAFGIGNMFQSNQLVAQTILVFPALGEYQLWIGILVAVLVGVVILGGIKGIARVNDKLFPLMAVLYIVSCLVVIGVNYRKMNPDNSVSGGPMYYLRDGLAKKGLKHTGKVLAVVFAVFASIGAFGIGNMFQSNQLVAQTILVFPALGEYQLWLYIVTGKQIGRAHV